MTFKKIIIPTAGMVAGAGLGIVLYNVLTRDSSKNENTLRNDSAEYDLSREMVEFSENPFKPGYLIK